MKFYLAPMEGITGYLYRKAYHSNFSHIEKYFTPFIAPNQNRCMNTRERKDVLPEHNTGLKTVPQIMTSSSENFNRTVQELKDMGYEEVNLNLGCPSRTVVTKKRGAGFLAFPDELERFLDEIYAGGRVSISIKTRIGMENPEEFHRLLEIYNHFPVKELIVHPRTQSDYYKNTPNWDAFCEAVRNSKAPVCYNGDIFTIGDLEKFKESFPDTGTVMLGRGILKMPGLADLLTTGERPSISRWKRFHDQLLNEYQEVSSGEKDVLFKMKELWNYLIQSFTDGEKYIKKIRKAQSLKGYRAVVEALFQEQQINVEIR